jgi:hypothetical protein
MLDGTGCGSLAVSNYEGLKPEKRKTAVRQLKLTAIPIGNFFFFLFAS